MTKEKAQPALGTAGTRAAEVRKARLAAALRENLRKRKRQARERAESVTAPSSAGNDKNH